MKYIKIILLLFCGLMCISASKPEIAKRPNITTSSIVGPFLGDEDFTVKFLFNKCNPTYTLTIKYYIASTNKFVISETYPASSIVGTLKSGTWMYTLQLKNRLTDKGLRIEFRMYDDNTELADYIITLYPKYVGDINGFDYTNIPFSIKDRTFKFNTTMVVGTEEIFKFDNTIKSLPINKDYSINIDEMHYTYDFYDDIENLVDNKYLRIRDINNCYPKINKDVNGYFNVPIELIQNDDEINMKFSQTMYYNPKTLDMSFTKLNDYIETNNFYIHPSLIPSFKDGDFEFILKDVSYNDLTIHLPMEINYSNNLIGLCHDSQYCFSGGIKE